MRRIRHRLCSSMHKALLTLVMAATLLLLAPEPVRAQEAGGGAAQMAGQPLRLSVEQAVARAVAANLALRREALTLSQREREAQYAFNRFYPSVDATGSLSRSNFTTTDDPWTVSAGISSSLTLSLPLLKEGRETAQAYVRGLISYETAEQALRRDVQRAFYDLLVRERRIALRRQNLETARLRYERSVVEYEAGRVSRYTMLSLRVAFERQRPELATLEDGYRDALAAFSLLLDLPRNAQLELQGAIQLDVGELDGEALIARHLHRRGDVRLAELDRSSEELGLEVERDRLAPSLSLGYSYSQSNSAPFTAPWFDGEDRWRTGGQLSLGVRVPLAPHAPASGSRVARANRQDRVERSEIALAETVRRAETDIQQLVRRIERGRATLEVVRLNEELAGTALELAEVEYQRGLIDSFELRNAQLEFEAAQLDVLEEEFRIKSALIDLEFAINAPL